ncbi:AMP-binding protein [Streptomyces sp. NPDC059957]|uniref:AMP-binding protein n=1 Tax=unclassified Streptomyces TaxID=2593676 RepID=UPI00366A1C25
MSFLRPDATQEHLSYAGLLTDASRVTALLRTSGVRPGETVLLRCGDDPGLLTAFWACVLGGFVPMPVGARRAATGGETADDLLELVWNGYGKPWVISETMPLTAGDTWLGPASELLERSGRGPRDDRAATPAWHQAAPEDTAVLLLTSGSTGVPKAVALSHRNVLSRSAATAQVNRLGPATRTFNWMPLDHVGGLVMFHLRDVFLGCAQLHAPFDWVLEDPLRWLSAADGFGADTTWAPNFAFALVNDHAERLSGQPWDLRRLRYIMNGGEAVRGAAVDRFLDLLAPFGLPRDAMRPGWGMSETSAGVTDCRFAELDLDGLRYVPVGRPQPGTAVRVVGSRGEDVAPGTLGHLEVRGATVTSGYYRNPAQNLRSFSADGWFRTGDLALVEEGLLTVTGRADDLIECGGTTFHGHEIEAVVEELDFVDPSFTVACAVPAADGADGAEEHLAIFYHQRPGTLVDDPAAAIRARVVSRLGVDPAHVIAVGREDIPKTGVGKLRRTQLRDRFTESPPATGATAAAP